MLFVPRFRRALNEKAVICFCPCLYQVLSHILGVSLPPSACLNPLCRHPPPSSEGGEGAPAPRTQSTLCNLTQLAFERRRWRMRRERQAAAVRKCESEQPKHERLSTGEPRFALSLAWRHRGAEIRTQSCSAITAEPCAVCAMFAGMKKFFRST